MHFLLYEPITLLEFSILSACLSPFVKKIGIWLSHSRSCFKKSFLLNSTVWVLDLKKHFFDQLWVDMEQRLECILTSDQSSAALILPTSNNYTNMWLKYMSFFFGIGNEWICYKSFEMGWSCAITELSETLYWIPSKEYIRSLKVIGDPANYKSHPYWWQNT